MKTRTTLMLCVLGVIGLAWATPAQAALVGFWNFNEGSGSDAADFSPNANDGALLSGASWATGHTGAGGDSAVHLNGNNARVEMPDSASFDTITDTFTIALWANESWSGNYLHLLCTTNGSDRRWLFQSDSGGGDSAYVWSEVSGNWQQRLGFTISDGSWHHYAFTYTGGTMTSYVDGSPFTTYSVGADFPDFTDSLVVGWRPSWTSFEGDIDDVAFFNTVEDIGSIKDGTHPEIPEPATLALLGLGGLGLILRRKRR